MSIIQHLQALIPQQKQEITKLKSWFNGLTEEMQEDEDMQDYIQQNLDLLSFMEQNLSYLTYKLEQLIIQQEDDISADEDEDNDDYNVVEFH